MVRWKMLKKDSAHLFKLVGKYDGLDTFGSLSVVNHKQGEGIEVGFFNISRSMVSGNGGNRVQFLWWNTVYHLERWLVRE